MLPQMLGLASPRIALPLDLAEDGPIYVNAKQYHGILRRRQSRAKLEAQNKLIKSRKVCSIRKDVKGYIWITCLQVTPPIYPTHMWAWVRKRYTKTDMNVYIYILFKYY